MPKIVQDHARGRLAVGAASSLLALAGCSASTHAARTPASAPASPSLMVTSSIVDGAHLDPAVQWSASVVPATDVAVDFLVDNKVMWTERNAPYYFNDDKYLLAPWLLGAGAHTLAVRATTSSGATASATSHVTVAVAPKVPTALLGTFRRTMTQADLTSTSTVPGYDPAGDKPPPGVWTIQFGSNYLIPLGDPTNPPGENEMFQASAAGDLTLAGPANWLTPVDLRGGLCEPAPIDHYHWVVKGRVLTITGGTNCPNRKALFEGTWTRR